MPGPDNQGFRSAFYIMAVVVVAFTLLATFFLATPQKPSQLGLLPYGAAPRTSVDAVSPREASRPVPGFTFAQALRTPWLWILFGCSVVLGIVHAVTQIIAPYLTYRVTAAPPLGLGQDLAFYSLLMSVWTIGLIVLKPVLGVLNDKLGIVAALIIALTLQGAFFVFLPHFAAFGTIIPLVGMLFLSAGMSTGTVEPPLLTAQAMGPRDFGKIWSVAGSAYTLGLAAGAPIWGLFFHPAERSYTLGFYLAPVALGVVVAAAVIGMRSGRRQHPAMHAEELAAWEREHPLPG